MSVEEGILVIEVYTNTLLWPLFHLDRRFGLTQPNQSACGDLKVAADGLIKVLCIS